MLGWVRRIWSGTKPETPVKDSVTAPTARLDNARHDTGNAAHWSFADALGPNATYSQADRRTVRDRARYEVSNNSFAYGISNSIADDAIGTGPRLQLLLPEPDPDEPIDEPELAVRDTAVRALEDSWQRWSDETGLTDTLRLMYRAGAVDGESFATPITNPKLTHPVKLQLRSFECDRVTDPNFFPVTDPLNVDGIRYDTAGNPVSYTILKQHPGEQFAAIGVRDFDVVPAASVFHWYRPDRPGQARGVSWLTPALGLFAMLRRYSLAVLAGAETAANISAVLETDLGPNQEAPDIKPMSEFTLPRNTGVALPAGLKLAQLAASPHTQTFSDFRAGVLTEIGRVLDMPLARVSGSSTGYNFSQSRVDHMGYHRFIWISRDRLRRIILDRLFRMWLTEATLAGEIPDGLPPFDLWQWDFQFDGFESFDPLKEANAAKVLLDANLTDLSELCAARGRRWDQVLRQRSREKKLEKQLGIGPPAPPPAFGPQPPASPADDTDDDDDDDDDADVDAPDEEEVPVET